MLYWIQKNQSKLFTFKNMPINQYAININSFLDERKKKIWLFRQCEKRFSWKKDIFHSSSLFRWLSKQNRRASEQEIYLGLTFYKMNFIKVMYISKSQLNVQFVEKFASQGLSVNNWTLHRKWSFSSRIS